MTFNNQELLQLSNPKGIKFVVFGRFCMLRYFLFSLKTMLCLKGINSGTLRSMAVMVLLYDYKMWNKSNLNVINQMKHLLLNIRYSTLTIFFSFVYFSHTDEN